jgi:hypothetical protein
MRAGFWNAELQRRSPRAGKPARYTWGKNFNFKFRVQKVARVRLKEKKVKQSTGPPMFEIEGLRLPWL